MTGTEILDEDITRVRRWGKWGEDDQFGAMNFVRWFPSPASAVA